MKSNRITLFILLGNLFIAFLGIGLIIPILPTIMKEFGVSGVTVGYLTASFAIAQLIVSPFAGKAVDKIGRKVMIVSGLVIFSLSELLFGLGTSIEALFISRILGGVSGAFIMPAATAFIADITTNKTRPKALGYMSASINLGFIIGPGLGGFLAEITTRTPFFAASILGALAAICSFVLLKEPQREQSVENINETLKKESSLKKIMSPLFFLPLVLIFTSSFGLASLESFFSLFVDHKFNFTPKDVAIAITGGAIVGAIFQLVLFDPMIRKWGEINIIRYSLIYSVIFIVAVTMAPTYWTVMLVCFIVFIGFDLIRPALTTYLSKNAGNEQGFVGGMNSMFTSFANILGPVLGGILFDIDINFPYYFAAILLFISFVLALFWKKQRNVSL